MRRFFSRYLFWGAAFFAASHVSIAQTSDSQTADRQGVFLAPGWGKLSFEAPEAGTYTLPALDAAANGEVLNHEGKSLQLDDLTGEKLTLLSFIYRTCDDVNGCPLSTMVLYSVANTLAKEPELNDKLRILTLSFDPEGDTPEAMSEYKEDILGDTDLDWRFLTTRSNTELLPILDAYQQTVVQDRKSEDGKGKFSHILRVYLIDKERQIRNIYSLSFLHPDILVNDVKTLLMEDANIKSLQANSEQ